MEEEEVEEHQEDFAVVIEVGLVVKEVGLVVKEVGMHRRKANRENQRKVLE